MRHGLRAWLAVFLFALAGCDGKGDERLRALYRDDAMVACRPEAEAAAPTFSPDAIGQVCRCAIDRHMEGRSGVDLRLARDSVGEVAHRGALDECLEQLAGLAPNVPAPGSPRQVLRVQMKAACLAQAVPPDQAELRARADRACECAVARYVAVRSDQQLVGERPFEELEDDLLACGADAPPPVRAHLDEIRANGIDACARASRVRLTAVNSCTCAVDRFLSRPEELERARRAGQMPFPSAYRADIEACGGALTGS